MVVSKSAMVWLLTWQVHPALIADCDLHQLGVGRLYKAGCQRDGETGGDQKMAHGSNLSALGE